MTCVVQYADKTLAIFTPVRSVHLQPIQLKFATDLDMEAWQADLTKGECHDRGVGQCYCHNFWRFSSIFGQKMPFLLKTNFIIVFLPKRL
jgi:hypothetical protein